MKKGRWKWWMGNENVGSKTYFSFKFEGFWCLLSISIHWHNSGGSWLTLVYCSSFFVQATQFMWFCYIWGRICFLPDTRHLRDHFKRHQVCFRSTKMYVNGMQYWSNIDLWTALIFLISSKWATNTICVVYEQHLLGLWNKISLINFHEQTFGYAADACFSH